MSTVSGDYQRFTDRLIPGEKEQEDLIKIAKRRRCLANTVSSVCCPIVAAINCMCLPWWGSCNWEERKVSLASVPTKKEDEVEQDEVGKFTWRYFCNPFPCCVKPGDVKTYYMTSEEREDYEALDEKKYGSSIGDGEPPTLEKSVHEKDLECSPFPSRSRSPSHSGSDTD